MSHRSKSKHSRKPSSSKQQRKPAPRSRPVFLPCRADEYRSRAAGLALFGVRVEPVHASRRLADPLPGGRAEYVARWTARQVA